MTAIRGTSPSPALRGRRAAASETVLFAQAATSTGTTRRNLPLRMTSVCAPAGTPRRTNVPSAAVSAWARRPPESTHSPHSPDGTIVSGEPEGTRTCALATGSVPFGKRTRPERLVSPPPGQAGPGGDATPESEPVGGGHPGPGSAGGGEPELMPPGAHAAIAQASAAGAKRSRSDDGIEAPPRRVQCTARATRKCERSGARCRHDGHTGAGGAPPSGPGAPRSEADVAPDRRAGTDAERQLSAAAVRSEEIDAMAARGQEHGARRGAGGTAVDENPCAHVAAQDQVRPVRARLRRRRRGRRDDARVERDAEPDVRRERELRVQLHPGLEAANETHLLAGLDHQRDLLPDASVDGLEDDRVRTGRECAAGDRGDAEEGSVDGHPRRRGGVNRDPRGLGGVLRIGGRGQ